MKIKLPKLELINISLIYSALFIGCMILSPIFNAKVVSVWGLTFLAWTPMAAVTSALIDAINQNWGKIRARQTVTTGIIVRAIFYFGIFPILFLLPDTRELGINDLFKQTFRNALVSEGLTFFGRCFYEIPLFAWMKSKFEFKYNVANWSYAVIKQVARAFLMYIGVVQVKMGNLLIGEVIVTIVFITLATPLASLLNIIAKKWQTKNSPSGQ